ncbi:MAG: hypothetical protein A2Z99_10330 [Treponema sp. GWB1_62_6]|nr:MAG: hypothetical protein A2Z99_10330 [Treponema sp. GWB1_62_6]OHE66992.1 MAG: hypothetical protein A2001_08075 [Treponema sp. GWC1_61_84]OHE70906.1 MAG: hypothetical protein A2413_13270 [Treponema sp. RIFOXYC1_FULL_61_9]HCM25452.1 hypothetical protein [Treponema sp.]
MPFPLSDIDILCRVVDNFGDIGVVYRLAKALSALRNPPRLRLIVDDLGAFARLAPGLDPSADLQVYRGWTVAHWDGPVAAAAVTASSADDRVIAEFRRKRPRVIIECFGCGRPGWLEDILFDPSDPVPRLIVDLEYLSAEDFAGDYHCLPSLTRSPLVRKALFMPGFTEKTGGLILDGPHAERGALRRSLTEWLGLPADTGQLFWVTVFSYERDFTSIVRDLALFGAEKPVLVLAAAGKSQEPFRDAWDAAGKPFPVAFLPFLSQETWDEALLAADFSIVRGEDSFSRACLSGRPFLWQAYPQDGRHQLVKVHALMDLLQPFLETGDFKEIKALHLAFNDRDRDDPAATGEERLLPVLRRAPESEKGFAIFSSRLRQNGDLAANLMKYLTEIE